MYIFVVIVLLSSILFATSGIYEPSENISLYNVPTTPSAVYRPLTDVIPIFQAWYQAVISAKKDIWFSTYVWHVHQVKDYGFITPHIYYMGLALKELDESLDHDVPARFLINQSVWMSSTRYIHDCWQQTWSLWHELGFRGKHVKVEFYAWKHYSLNNIHGKLLLVDDTESVMTSINVEQESYGGPNSWYESGAWVSDVKANDTLKTFLKPYIERSRLLDVPSIVSVPGKRGGLTRDGKDVTIDILKQSLPSFDNVSLNTITDDSSIRAIGYHDSNITQEILDMIRSAKYSIQIMTPSFNLDVVWEALVEQCELHSELKVEIMTGWHFNESHPHIQRYILNYRVNSDYVRYKLLHSQIKWKWYAEDGVKVHRHGGPMCHAKVVLVDGVRGKCSSFNLDTWSSQYSMETAFFFEDARVAKYYQDHLFVPRWNRGELIGN